MLSITPMVSTSRYIEDINCSILHVTLSEIRMAISTKIISFFFVTWDEFHT